MYVYNNNDDNSNIMKNTNPKKLNTRIQPRIPTQHTPKYKNTNS